ncbi:MAG: hypothetical protein ABTQ32_30540 [Myxococcaceae bacterium]
MSRNFAEEARALSNQLEAIGAMDFATALREAIDFSSTGSEILFGLRFHLHQFIATPPTDLHATARELADAIDAAIRR